jgi:hypothetical protein
MMIENDDGCMHARATIIIELRKYLTQKNTPNHHHPHNNNNNKNNN